MPRFKLVLAMATLLQLMTFDDWLSMVRNIEVIVPGSWLFFVGFVMMGALGFLNLMTAVFVDSIILLQNVEAHQRAQRMIGADAGYDGGKIGDAGGFHQDAP